MLHIVNCDIGFTLSGTQYQFNDIDDVAIEDTKRHGLVRGMNATNKVGIPITEGQDQPYVITTNVKDVSKALFEVMKQAYNDISRFDFWVIDRKNGAKMRYNNCIFNEEPMQKNIASGAETVTMALVMHSFDKQEDIKD